MTTDPIKKAGLPVGAGKTNFGDRGQACRITVVAVMCLYTGIAVSCLPYLLLLTDSWIESVAAQCQGRPDLCVEVSSEVRYVRGWWRGRAFFFVAQPGKGSQLKALFREGCPADFLDQIQSPCYYVGISVIEQ